MGLSGAVSTGEAGQSGHGPFRGSWAGSRGVDGPGARGSSSSGSAGTGKHGPPDAGELSRGGAEVEGGDGPDLWTVEKTWRQR